MVNRQTIVLTNNLQTKLDLLIKVKSKSALKNNRNIKDRVHDNLNTYGFRRSTNWSFSSNRSELISKKMLVVYFNFAVIDIRTKCLHINIERVYSSEITLFVPQITNIQDIDSCNSMISIGSAINLEFQTFILKKKLEHFTRQYFFWESWSL